MDLKPTKSQIVHGPVARRVVFRTLFVASAMSIIPLVHILTNTNFGMLSTSPDCLGKSDGKRLPGSYLFHNHILLPLWDSAESVHCEGNMNLTVNVVKELMEKQLLNYSAKSLCVGDRSASAVLAMRELGFSNAIGVEQYRPFSLKWKKFVYELDYKEKSFDFVFSMDLDKVSVPALLVLEIERVLKPGGIGAVIVGATNLGPNNLVRSATPVSSLLKASGVVHVGCVRDFILVAFKKKYENVGYFEKYRLPADCPTLTNNRPLIDQMEPLVKDKPTGFEKRVSYLPKFVDVSSKKRLVYVDIGAGKNPKLNARNWFMPNYPLDRRVFNTYFVDHNTSVLLSYVQKPGITFVYHPGLADTKAEVNITDDGGVDPPVDEDGFNFLAWFKETVDYADFVVLKMNAGKVELKFLSELFESGVICFVDELFLGCSDGPNDEGALRGGCMELFDGLRSSGVFVHQWWENDTALVW